MSASPPMIPLPSGACVAVTFSPSMDVCTFAPAPLHSMLIATAVVSEWWQARHTLVGGSSSLYIISQAGGAHSHIDSVAVAEVAGGGAWRPPQSFIGLRCAGPCPIAVDGFCAVYTRPVAGMRLPAGATPPPPPPKSASDEEDEGEPPAEDTEEPSEFYFDVGPCLWIIGGTAANGMHATLDYFSIEEERWMGDPFANEADAILPTPVTNGAACVMPGTDTELVYFFGGKNKEGALSDELWMLDLRRLMWVLIESGGEAPAPRECHTMTRVLTRYLLLFGGIGAEGTPCLDVDLLDTTTSTWSSHRPSPALPRVGHGAASAFGCLYIFGGTDGAKATNSVHSLECHQLFPQTAALAFTGEPDKAMVAKASPSLNALTDKFSLECWVCPNSFVLNGPAVCKADGGLKTGFGIVAIDEATAKKYVALEKEKVKEGGPKERNPWEGALAEAEMLPTMCFFAGGMRRESCALMRIHPGEWSHLAATFDGKAIITYVNGKRADYIVPDPPLTEGGAEIPHPKDGDLCIGGIPGKVAFDGAVDGVRLWSRELSWEEVRERMNDTLHGSEHPALIGQWSCNEGAGDLCVDSSSRCNHGFLEGGVQRIMCKRDRIEPTKTSSEVHVEANFDRIRKWRREFEKRAGREVTAADLLLADDDIRKTARRLGLI